MPAQPRKTTQPKVDVGDVQVTAEEIATAIEALVTSEGIMIAQPLRKIGNALAGSDYHAVAKAERKMTGEAAQTKVAFISALRRICPE